MLSLDREDTISLGRFLTFHLVQRITSQTPKLLKPDHTICQWKADIVENGSIPDYKQGRHQRTGVVWSSEELNQKATKYVRE